MYNNNHTEAQIEDPEPGRPFGIESPRASVFKRWLNSGRHAPTRLGRCAMGFRRALCVADGADTRNEDGRRPRRGGENGRNNSSLLRLAHDRAARQYLTYIPSSRHRCVSFLSGPSSSIRIPRARFICRLRGGKLERQWADRKREAPDRARVEATVPFTAALPPPLLHLTPASLLPAETVQ